jgi:hypothetical protein
MMTLAHLHLLRYKICTDFDSRAVGINSQFINTCSSKAGWSRLEALLKMRP